METTNCTYVRTVLITFKYSISLESNFKDEVAVLQSTEIDSRLFPHIEKLMGTFLTHKDQEKCLIEFHPKRGCHSNIFVYWAEKPVILEGRKEKLL